MVLLIEAGTHLITDALMCPYRIGERVRALKLLRSVNESMLLMWDRGFHSYQMVNSTLAHGCQYLGRVPSNVKFPYHQILDDGSYLSWINPDRKSKKKGKTNLRLGFTGTLKVIRRAIPDFQDLKSEQLPFFSHG